MEISQQERDQIQEKVNKLKESRFKQQTLPAWRPIPSFASTMITFGVFGLIFLCLGIVLYIMSDQIQEVVVDYTTTEQCSGSVCVMSVDIAETIESPIYVYYQLENFYQNHRRYVKSRDYQQLMGEVRTLDEISSSCDPITQNSDLTATNSVNGTPLVQDEPANPCGLVAKSVFTDSYQFYSSLPTTSTAYTTGMISIDTTNIAWKSDQENKFKNCEDCKDSNGNTVDWEAVQWTNVTDPHFIVWMRTAGLPNFRKLWGQIDQTLEGGKTYYVQIQNNYPVASFNGSKSFVLSTTNMLG